MQSIGTFRAGTCDGIGRRAFLQAGARLPWLPAGLAAGSLFSGVGPAGTSASAQPPQRLQPRIKSVIFVWLWGAPSHLDTFDPKPDAPAEYRGPFTPIATKTPGLQFTELLPQLAMRSGLYNVIRSHVTFAPGHPDAGTFGLTGFAEKPEPVQPNFGSIIARHRGRNPSTLPSFVSVGRGVPRDVVRIVEGWGGGTLGKAYDPFLISCSETGEAEIPSLQLLEGLHPLRLSDRRLLLDKLDTARRGLDHVATREWNQTFDQAYSLLTRSEARKSLDLSQEPQALRARYGQTAFGQSCLLARRLVQSGVPYVQVNWSEFVECMTPNCDFGWDTHIFNFELLQDRHGPIFDRAFSALLDDLNEQGLLDSTLVVAMGEFGRTPKINKRAARDHWHRCYSSIWAGGGLPGGRVIGHSDKYGEDPVTAPITPLMVGTTLAELFGMDTQARAELKVLDGGSVIHELL